MSDRLHYIKEFNDKIFNNDVVKNKNTIIFIYTPPKVASTSLVSSLRLSGAKFLNVVHVHDERMLSILANYDNKENVTINEIIKYNASIGKNVFVIDVYRNPIERKISEYFEQLASFHFNVHENNIINYNIELIIKRFNSLFPFIGKEDYFFDKYEINIPEHFDFNNKYLLVNKDNVKYLKLRLCDSNEWDKILSKVLNMDIVVIKDYQTESKAIGDLYKRFKDNYHIPCNLLETIKSCKYFNYYNSDSEKNTYLEIWNNKIHNSPFEPYSLKKYNFYIDLCKENQFYNFIQRDHYLDFGCVCKSCCYKRRQIFYKIKRGEYTDIKIIHEQAVHEKNVRKVEKIGKICNQITNTLNKISNKNGKNKIGINLKP
jgi:hypothetical protein